MIMCQAERSKYYRGLLVVVAKDRFIDTRERELMLQIGELLDFDKRFCAAALDDLLKNPHVKGKPVVFSEVMLAECFLHDATRLALVDQDLHPKEMAWLKTVAQANGLTDEWLDKVVRRFSEDKENPDQSLIAIQKHL